MSEFKALQVHHYPAGRFRWTTSYVYVLEGASPLARQVAAETERVCAAFRVQLKRHLADGVCPVHQLPVVPR